MKTIAIGVLISFAIIFSISSSMANQRIAMLEKNVEAQKMAMTFANSAIHEFYNKSKES
jgi:hypothetical protein